MLRSYAHVNNFIHAYVHTYVANMYKVIFVVHICTTCYAAAIVACTYNIISVSISTITTIRKLVANSITLISYSYVASYIAS